MPKPANSDFITTHFRYSEFIAPDRFSEWTSRPSWLVVDFLLYRLCSDHLEPTRAILEHPLYVSSGARDRIDTARIESQGKSPSWTSDHSFGDEFYPLGVGAADILKLVPGDGGLVPVAFSKVEFEHVVSVRVENEENPPWGQFIHYPDLGHFHLANRRDVLYSRRAQDGLPFREYRARTYTKE